MKKKIMAVLLALAMVTQGAMPVFAQNEGAEGIETAADAETAKILCKEYFVIVRKYYLWEEFGFYQLYLVVVGFSVLYVVDCFLCK